jgi:nanoRNase/pAp phosphatase (c-di-AMP/oligoRNAs hydrolase)
MQLATCEKYRLVTRSDFDGLVCAVLLKDRGIIDDIKFVHPKDMQDGKVEITDRDITTNLPYVAGAHLVFDHHSSEVLRNGSADNYVIQASAPSAARVVYDYYGGREAFPTISEAMMTAVDKGDAAQFNLDEILDPQGWDLLNFLMDARTGLGRFRISNYQLMMELIDYCKNHSIEEILALPDVNERVELYNQQSSLFSDQLKRCATMHGNLVVLDLRSESTIFAGNRFLIYALFPQSNISIHVLWGLNQQNTVFAVGKSILDRSSHTNIGELMLEYGGGGHENAGTCQLDNALAEVTLEMLVARINADG